MINLKKISVLGATGSVGINILKLILKDNKKYKVLALTAHRNYKLLSKYSKLLNVKFAAIADDHFLNKLKSELKYTNIKCISGTEAICKAAKIKTDIEKILIPRVKKNLEPRIKRLFKGDFKLFVNPTGKFVIGGPHGDTGLTGRKIIVDTYGGRGAHGGGAFSGKDSSKVDRSAAYAARHIAKNLVAAGVAKEILVQLAYAIGVAEPVGVYVNTRNTSKLKNAEGKKLTDGEIALKVKEIFDLRPYSIVSRYGLTNPIFEPTASYGHFGRDPFVKEVEVYYQDDSTIERDGKYFKEVEFFAWEKLDYVDKIKESFKL